MANGKKIDRTDDGDTEATDEILFSAADSLSSFSIIFPFSSRSRLHTAISAIFLIRDSALNLDADISLRQSSHSCAGES